MSEEMEITSTPVVDSRPTTATSTKSEPKVQEVKKVEEVKPVTEAPKANQPAGKGKQQGDLFMQLTDAKEKGNG